MIDAAGLGIQRYVAMATDQALLAISYGVPLSDAIKTAISQALEDQSEATDIALRILSRQGDKAGAKWYERHSPVIKRIRPAAGVGTELPVSAFSVVFKEL